MKLKCILGFCAFKGCKNRGIYHASIKLAKGEKAFKICEKHLHELSNRSSGITVDVGTMLTIKIGE